jgi:hypothetical protein
MRRTLTLAAAALAIAAPAASAPQADKDLATEARLAAKYPGLIKRNGNTLRIGSKSFTDKGRCANDDSDCATYRAVQVRGDYVGVRAGYYEGSDYYFVRRDGQVSTNVGDDPLPSPNGKRFFVLVWDPHTFWDPLKGAAVWEWRQGPQRLRVVDEGITYVNRLVAWRSNACVEMLAADTDEARDAGQTHRVWLAEQNGDWRLSRKRPPICTG